MVTFGTAALSAVPLNGLDLLIAQRWRGAKLGLEVPRLVAPTAGLDATDGHQELHARRHQHRDVDHAVLLGADENFPFGDQQWPPGLVRDHQVGNAAGLVDLFDHGLARFDRGSQEDVGSVMGMRPGKRENGKVVVVQRSADEQSGE